jgi:hypothetical protein
MVASPASLGKRLVYRGAVVGAIIPIPVAVAVSVVVAAVVPL